MGNLPAHRVPLQPLPTAPQLPPAHGPTHPANRPPASVAPALPAGARRRGVGDGGSGGCAGHAHVLQPALRGHRGDHGGGQHLHRVRHTHSLQVGAEGERGAGERGRGGGGERLCGVPGAWESPGGGGAVGLRTVLVAFMRIQLVLYTRTLLTRSPRPLFLTGNGENNTHKHAHTHTHAGLSFRFLNTHTYTHTHTHTHTHAPPPPHPAGCCPVAPPSCPAPTPCARGSAAASTPWPYCGLPSSPWCSVCPHCTRSHPGT